jgi:hypothetical protein
LTDGFIHGLLANTQLPRCFRLRVCPGLVAGPHSHREAIDETLGMLADLDRRQTDDLHGEIVAHFIQHGGASLGVKLPALIHGAPADELFSQLGNAVFLFLHLGK